MFYLFAAKFILLWTSCECGLRIIGGRNALQNEYTYVVRLEEQIRESEDDTILNYDMFCTGAALTSHWVLSAAHCVEDTVTDTTDGPSMKFKMFVRYNSYFPNNSGVVTPVNDVIIHPGFTKTVGIMKFDNALLRCVDIKISDYGKVSAVDFRSLVGYEADSLGFGNTNASSIEKPLQVLKGMLNTCYKHFDDSPHMICLVRPCAVKATICSGDSGGPVVHASGIVGVNSMSADNCYEYTKHLKLTPGTSASIISPVSPVTDWITNVIAK